MSLAVSPFEVAAARFQREAEPGPDYLADPRRWVADKGLFLYSRQLEIIESVRDNHDTTVQSCHSAGKSFTAASACAWWLDAHIAGEAFVLTTAPTGDQVKAILWKEIGKLHRLLGLPGRVNLTEWYIGPEIVGMGRKPNEYDDASFQGIHAPEGVLIVLDEAGGVPKELWDAAQSVASNDKSRILAIGNPDNPTGEFASSCKPDSGYNVIQIPASATPNFTGEDVPERVKSSLISVNWAEGRRKKWGEDSALYQAKVLAKFPTETTDGIVPLSWAQRCRELEEPGVASGEIQGGLDPASRGADRAVLWIRQGPVALAKHSWPYTPDPRKLAELVVDQILAYGIHKIKIDADGLGWGISGILDEKHANGEHDCISVPVYGSIKASDEEHFLNTRAETWWMGRELSRLRQWDLSRLDDDDLAELTAPRYHTNNPKARIQVEKKEETRKRLGVSPDSADALLLAYVEVTHDVVDYSADIAAARVT